MSGFSQQAILSSWLLLYAAWRLFTAFNYGVAAYRFESGIFLFYFGAIAALAVLSLVGIAVLWQRKRTLGVKSVASSASGCRFNRSAQELSPLVLQREDRVSK